MGGSESPVASSACSASARAASLASQRASRLRATSRFSGSQAQKGALGAVSVVPGAFDGELGGAADALVPACHLIGGAPPRPARGARTGPGRGRWGAA